MPTVPKIDTSAAAAAARTYSEDAESNASLASDRSRGSPVYVAKPSQQSAQSAIEASPALGRTQHLGRGAGRKLPHMSHAGPPPTGGNLFPTHHPPLPGIKKNRNFRENTFEITGAGFDIRFHHVIPSRGETPPQEIRQNAIEKCQQWLIRYTPRR